MEFIASIFSFADAEEGIQSLRSCGVVSARKDDDLILHRKFPWNTAKPPKSSAKILCESPRSLRL
ncbi:MAG: hypothetical protein NUW37_16520, partial [Planctomycetes bacterium]|nr:hypothetical protein [Planctomycetota bacterium]